MQEVAPLFGEYEPGLHAVAAVARARLYEPASTGVHVVAPLADWNVPAVHALQMPAPALEMVPGSQGVAALLPVGHAEPAGHGSQSLGAVAPVVLR